MRDKRKRIFYTFTILAVFILIAVFLIHIFVQKEEARRVLSHAKSIRLATQVTYYDYYASDRLFFDDSKTGLRKGGEKEILKLAQCEGSIRHVAFNKDNFRVSRLIYMEKGYIVEFTDSGDNPQWTVYKLEKILD